MTSTTRKAPWILAHSAQTAIAAAAVSDVFRAVALRDHHLRHTQASLTKSAHMSVIFSNLMFLAVVLFLVWLARSRRIARDLSPRASVPGPVWTIGAWFVPVVNLFVPRRFLLDIGRASSLSWERSRNTALVNLWWAAWLMHVVVVLAEGRVAPGSVPFLVSEEALMIAAAVLLALVIKRVTALQSAALDSTAPVAAPARA